jgi:transcriptional regulator GlxA family with amidase domain
MFDGRSFKTPDPAVAEILQLIRKNCAQHDLSLNLLSRKANLSTRHLGRLFQKHTGQSFRDYLRRARMQRAAELLAQRHDVKTVAALVGYSSRTHFDQDFRVRFGCTPAQFKRTARAAS